MPDLAPIQRQRRFLIIMSLAVVAFYWLGASVSGDAEMNGLKLHIRHPERAVAGLWIIWGWALWRYMQRLYEFASVAGAEIVEDVNAEDQRLAMRAAKAHATRLARKGAFDHTGALDRTNVVVDRIIIASQSRDDDSANARRESLFSATETRGRRYNRLQAVLHWGAPDALGGGLDNFEFVVTRRAARWLRLRAWICAIVALPGFSEYAAPLLIAVAAPTALLYSISATS